MNRYLILALLSFSVAAGCATTGSQGLTVGDALSKGARQLTASEVKSLFSGATVEGQSNESGNSFRAAYTPDGKFSGVVTRSGFRFDGNWTVNEKNQICSNLMTAGARGGEPCQYIYALDGKYYAATTAEKTGDLLERRFSR
ncbi:MAG: hypothetical protein AB7G13_17435 [Lautropia sp.]